MSTPIHDAAIVGAGPAGSTLALLLARAGCDVVLIDRATFPRPKPCGDCLSAAAARLLARLGLLDTVQALAPAHLAGWRIYGPRAACFAAAFDALGDPDPLVHTGLALPREHLDAALLAAAASAGATVRCGWTATELQRAGAAVSGVRLRVHGGGDATVQARITVGADGLRSRIARRLDALRRPPRVRKLSFTTHVARASGGDWYGEMHVGDGICAGFAPVSAAGDCWNLTLVADADRFGQAARAPRAFFRTALASLPVLAGLDLEPAELLASGPFDSPTRRTTFDGAVLLGDAAGYFDPFTGQGMYQALAGAEQLARVLVPLLRPAHSPPGDRSPAPVSARQLQPYARAHRALTRGPKRVQRLIHYVLDHPGLAELAIAGLARRPRAATALLAVTSDLRPAGSLLSPGLALSLLLPRPAAQPGPSAPELP